MDQLTVRQVRWLAANTPPSRSSIVQLRSALSHYWKMIGYQGPINSIIIPTEQPSNAYKGLPYDDADRIEMYARTHPNGMLALIGLHLGLRRSEMAVLRWEDFTPDTEWVKVHGKGSRQRTIPVSDELREVLQPSSGWLFPVGSGHIPDTTVYSRIRALGQEAGIGRIRPHALRHTCLTRLYQQTLNLRLVQRFAGHSSSATTEQYAWVFDDQLQDEVRRFSYRDAA